MALVQQLTLAYLRTALYTEDSSWEDAKKALEEDAKGEAIGKPDLKWSAISDEQLLNGMVATGMSEQVAKGFVEMQASQGSRLLYEDYYGHKPISGKVKLADFAKGFVINYIN